MPEEKEPFEDAAPPGTPQAQAPPLWRRGVTSVLVVAILTAAGWVSYYWMTHRPMATRRHPPARAALVEVRRVAPGSHPVTVKALGTVTAAQSMQLASRVAGEVVSISPEFVPGGRLTAGVVLARIDPRDFDLAVRQQQAEVLRRSAEARQRAADVRQRESDVTRAQSNLTLEMGQQSVARREYELLGKPLATEDKDLILRRPQLQIARADCAAAEAALAAAKAVSKAAEASKAAAEVDLEKARLDLQRTTIRAPFNAVVRTRLVDLGSQLAVGTPLASLVGSDEYWVEVSVPVDHLKWIRIPGVNGRAGSPARVYHESAWGREARRLGTVKRLMADLEPQGRMARLLVSVTDPLSLRSSEEEARPLILGAYVRVDISGPDLANVVRLPRTALRDGRRVWVMDPDKTLDIREVTIAWSGDEDVYVREGLADGEWVITSDLGAPVQGMALRLPAGGGGASSRPATGPAPAQGPEAGP